MKIENTRKISQIKIKAMTHNYCPIGKDWYTANIVIEMTPNKLIPDYLDVDRYILENINSRQYIIEDVSAKIFEYIEKTYLPKNICVTVNVKDAAHSEVSVIKERGVKNG